MTRLVDEVFDRLRADAQLDPSRLALRIDALTRFRQAAGPYLPPDWLEPAQLVSERVSSRLALSRAYTVVAIAGPTGSGKSSMFNALTGVDQSPVGVRRPTTGAPYACVWGRPAEAEPVLDRLGVPRSRRSYRDRSDMPTDVAPVDQPGLRGLILLDLPDFDSIERAHAAEAERLLELVDLMLWVVDPQKYADQSVHERQLAPLHRYQPVMAVALNQTDLLTAGETEQVLADLRRLLVADGLPEVPTVATSAVTAPAGLTDLHQLLEQVVTDKRAALRRLAADLDDAVAGLADLVGPEVPGHVAADRELVDGLSAAAGLPAVTDAAAWSYRRRAAAAMGWPVPRPRPEPPVLAPPNQATQQAAVSLAARAFADRAGAGLPQPWPTAIIEAGRSRLAEVPAALATAVTTALAADYTRTPWWWRLVGVALWAALAAAGLGVCWLLVGWLSRAVAVPVAEPGTGLRLLLVGVLGGGAVAVLMRPLARWAAWRAQARVTGELRAAVAEVGRAYVVAPVQQVRQAYGQARAALRAAGSG